MLKNPLLSSKETDRKPPHDGLRPVEQSIARSTWRHIVIPFVCALGGGLLAWIGYRHLAAQALSQGFVLDELRPITDAAIAAGSRVQFWNGRSRLIIIPGVFLFLLLSIIDILVNRKKAASNCWFFIIAGILLFLTALVETRSLIIYLVGFAGIIAIGWLGHIREIDDAPVDSTRKTYSIILATILLFALLIRLYHLDIFPARYTTDEQLLASSALELGESVSRFFSQPHYMKPHLVKIVEIRSAFALLGSGLFQQRTASALMGVLTVFFVYLLTRRLWGNRAGLFAAFLVAVDPWHIGYSKFGVHEIEGPLFLVLVLLVLIRLYESGGKRNYALVGALAGVSLYLYLANMILAPFALAAAALVGILRKDSWRRLAGGILLMTIVCILLLLPHLLLGRANVKAMLTIYSGSSNFLAAAKHYHVSPLLMVMANLAKAGKTFLQWGPSNHPAAEFHPNPLASALALLGLGMLLARIRDPKNLLILLWIPVAFLPVAIAFGFEERRLFSTLLPIPMMLGGFALARVWPDKQHETSRFGAIIARTFIIFVLALIGLADLHTTYADTDSTFGRPAQPQKAAEFAASLPSDYSVIITNRSKEYPFLLYLLNCDRLHRQVEGRNYGFMEFAEIEPHAQGLASKENLALLLDPGPSEQQFLEQIQKLNPNAVVIKKRDYWACILPQKN